MKSEKLSSFGGCFEVVSATLHDCRDLDVKEMKLAMFSRNICIYIQFTASLFFTCMHNFHVM